MAVNCRFAFGVHLLSLLAHFPDENFSSDKLAFTINTNAVVVRRMLLDLKSAGIVETQRGPGGGTRLAQPAGEITLAQIHRAVAGEIEIFGAHPNLPAQQCFVGSKIQGILEGISRRVANAVERELDAISLADVATQIQISEVEKAAVLEQLPTLIKSLKAAALADAPSVN